MKAALLLVALAALASQGALAHTYFKADMEPFGVGLENQPDASAILDFMTHDGEAFWTLNVTGTVNMTAAKIVYGNPDVYAEEVVTFYAADAPFSGDIDLDGVFSNSTFSAQYPWTMNGLMANAGLGHLWAVVINDADYKNIVLAAPLENYKPEGH